MGVKIGEILFEGPHYVDEWNPPRKAAIYAIVRKDNWKVLYIGESENLDDRGFWKGHHRYDCWVREAGSHSNLSIAIHPMPDSTLVERMLVESRLVKQLDPQCNR